MDNKYLCIIPECFVDTNLVQTLLQIRGTNHQKSCGNVTNQMKKRFANNFAVGIIDNDKKQSTYSKECVPIASSKEFTLCKHPGSNHYLVKITNIMETFILNSAKEINLEFKKEGFPDTLKGLKDLTKHENAKDSVELSRLFRKISKAKDMSLLADILNYLYLNKYDVKEDDVKRIFEKYGY